ncbi:MAG: hypothetical protein JNG84_09430 [Archangium sp.]|nr:hypothetical protein [Archangium sp.]
MSDAPQTVVLIGNVDHLVASLRQRLTPTWAVRCVSREASGDAWQADLTSVAEAEVALASAHTVVVLGRTSRVAARLMQGTAGDLDALLADTVARAAERVGAKQLVLWAHGEMDPREALLRTSSVPLRVVRGGQTDAAAAALAEAITAEKDATLDAPAAEVEPALLEGGAGVVSIQRYPVAKGLTASRAAEQYFEGLPSASPLTTVERFEGTWRIRIAGVTGLVLQHNPGRSETDSFVLEAVGGALCRVTTPPARFEFRVLRDGSLVTALIGFTPTLPWPVYRFSQALMHTRSMRRFGDALQGT